MAKKCRYCGHKLGEHDKICPVCKREVMDACPSCGNKLYENETYCSRCASEITETCPTCGRALYSDEKYCPYCGTKNEALKMPVNLGYGLPTIQLPQYGNYAGFANNYGTTPIVLPPISIDGTPIATEEAAAQEATRIRPAPQAEEAPKIKKSKLGIVGFIFAILSFFPLFWFISIPCCAVAIKRNNGYKGLAVAGLIITILWILAWIGLIVYMFVGGYTPVEEQLTTWFQDWGLLEKGYKFDL